MYLPVRYVSVPRGPDGHRLKPLGSHGMGSWQETLDLAGKLNSPFVGDVVSGFTDWFSSPSQAIRNLTNTAEPGRIVGSAIIPLALVMVFRK